MRARTAWALVMCGWSSVAAMGCVPTRPTPAPPKPVTPDDPIALREACQDPRLRWAGDTKARYHETIENASLKLVPEKGNNKTKAEDIEKEGRVLALLVVQSGELRFAQGTAGTGDSVCIFLQGDYPEGDLPGNVRSKFIRKRDGVELEDVGTYVRIGTPHKEAEVAWIRDYDSDHPKGAGMLPFLPPERVRKFTQTACPGGCCSQKKPV